MLLLSLIVLFLGICEASSKNPLPTSPTCDLIYIKSAGPIKDHANQLLSFIYYNSNNFLQLDQAELSKTNDLMISLSSQIECVILESYLEYMKAEKTGINDKFDYKVGQSQHFQNELDEDDLPIKGTEYDFGFKN
jgi:hypothetical protein